MDKQICDLKNEIQSDDWGRAIDAAEGLAEIGGQEVIDFLHQLLFSPFRKTRNAASIALREIGNESSVHVIIRAISQLSPDDDRDTLVYALQTMDCNQYFLPIFSLAVNGTYLEQKHAYDILSEQEFSFTQDDIINAQNELDNYIHRSNRPEYSNFLIDNLTILLNEMNKKFNKSRND